jgi:hypothetical protein
MYNPILEYGLPPSVISSDFTDNLFPGEKNVTSIFSFPFLSNKLFPEIFFHSERVVTAVSNILGRVYFRLWFPFYSWNAFHGLESFRPESFRLVVSFL